MRREKKEKNKEKKDIEATTRFCDDNTDIIGKISTIKIK
jgi:hypothetical protein